VKKPLAVKQRNYYRPNVGIVVINAAGQVFWGKRTDNAGWQFPQGGIDKGETPVEAMFRELAEETGLRREHVRLLGETRQWITYTLPPQYRRRRLLGRFKGQSQKWFLVRLVAEDEAIDLSAHGEPEFDEWQWVSYWYPVHSVVYFKKNAYRKMLSELVCYQTEQSA